MKKLLMKIFVLAITFIAMNTSLYCIPWLRLGKLISWETVGLNGDTGEWISTEYWEFGTVTFGLGAPIVYFYGSEDLPGSPGGGWGKRSIDIIANNEVTSFDENVHVYFYEANNVANQHSIQTKILNRGEEFSIQNSNLNLEKGKLYIIVFCNEQGAVLRVSKIMPTE